MTYTCHDPLNLRLGRHREEGDRSFLPHPRDTSRARMGELECEGGPMCLRSIQHTVYRLEQDI